METPMACQCGGLWIAKRTGWKCDGCGQKLTNKEYIAACMIVERDKQLASATAAREKAEAENVALRDLVRFLANTWSAVDDWAYKNGGTDAMDEYPVVQGTRNQINLKRIGEQPFDAKRVGEAVELMLTRYRAEFGGAKEGE